MFRLPWHRNRRRTSSPGLPGNALARIIISALILISLASFYIYQRVWVRRLDSEISLLRDRNERVERRLAELKKELAGATSITGLEKNIAEMKLGLCPSTPAQNIAVRMMALDSDRYTGLFKALDKLKEGIPLITPNEAEANQLFEAP